MTTMTSKIPSSIATPTSRPRGNQSKSLPSADMATCDVVMARSDNLSGGVASRVKEKENIDANFLSLVPGHHHHRKRSSSNNSLQGSNKKSRQEQDDNDSSHPLQRLLSEAAEPSLLEFGERTFPTEVDANTNNGNRNNTTAIGDISTWAPKPSITTFHPHAAHSAVATGIRATKNKGKLSSSWRRKPNASAVIDNEDGGGKVGGGTRSLQGPRLLKLDNEDGGNQDGGGKMSLSHELQLQMRREEQLHKRREEQKKKRKRYVTNYSYELSSHLRSSSLRKQHLLSGFVRVLPEVEELVRGITTRACLSRLHVKDEVFIVTNDGIHRNKMPAVVESIIDEDGVCAIEVITGRFGPSYFYTARLNLAEEAEETVPLEQDTSTATGTAASDITDTSHPSVSLMQVTTTATDITDTSHPSLSFELDTSDDTPYTLEDLQDPVIFGQMEEKYEGWLLRQLFETEDSLQRVISSGRRQITNIARLGGGHLRRLLFFAGHKKFSNFIQFYHGGGFWFSKRGNRIIHAILGMRYGVLHEYLKYRGFLHHPNNLKEKEGVKLSKDADEFIFIHPDIHKNTDATKFTANKDIKTMAVAQITVKHSEEKITADKIKLLLHALPSRQGENKGTSNFWKYQDVRQIVGILKPLEDEVVKNILTKYSLSTNHLKKLYRRTCRVEEELPGKVAQIESIVAHCKKETTTTETTTTGEDLAMEPMTNPVIESTTELIGRINAVKDVPDDCAIYDSCPEVAAKFREFLQRDIGKKPFCREAMGGASRSRCLNNFLAAKQDDLRGSAVYQKGYVFFEKLRILEGKPKSNMRMKNEANHPQGFSTKKKPRGKVAI